MSHSGKSVLVAAFLMSLSCGFAQSSAQGDPSKSTVDFEQSNVINNGDMLDIAVFESPDLSTKVRVGDDGDVLLPHCGNSACTGAQRG